MVTTTIILDKLFNYNKTGTPSDIPKWETKQTFLGKLKFYQVFLPVKNTSIELFHHLLEKKDGIPHYSSQAQNEEPSYSSQSSIQIALFHIFTPDLS